MGRFSAVVTYHDNENTNHDILIQNNTVTDQLSGRGYSVIGGHDVTIRSNYYGRGNAGNAGVMVAADGDFDTAGNWNIRIEGNTIKNAGDANGGPGAIWIFNTQADNITNHDITIEGNQIYAPKNDGIMILGGTNNQDIDIISNNVYGPGNLAVAQHGNPPNVTVQDTEALPLDSYPSDLVSAGGGVIHEEPTLFSLPFSGEYTNAVRGTSAADELTGTGSNDLFRSSRGADIVSGEKGNDCYVITDLGTG